MCYIINARTCWINCRTDANVNMCCFKILFCLLVCCRNADLCRYGGGAFGTLTDFLNVYASLLNNVGKYIRSDYSHTKTSLDVLNF